MTTSVLNSLQIQKYITLIYFVHELADLFHFWFVSHNYRRESARVEPGLEPFLPWSYNEFLQRYWFLQRYYERENSSENVYRSHPTQKCQLHCIARQMCLPLSLHIFIAECTFSSRVTLGPAPSPKAWILSISSIQTYEVQSVKL